MKVHGVIQTSDRNDKEYIVKLQEEMNAVRDWLKEEHNLETEQTFRDICIYEKGFEDKNVPWNKLLYWEQETVSSIKKLIPQKKKKKKEEVVQQKVEIVPKARLLEERFYKPFSLDDITE
jgi:hypothetical protein